MSDYIHSNEFMSWVKATLALQITRDGLCSFVEHEMKKFLKHFNGNDDHFLRFLGKLVFSKVNVQRKHKNRHGKDFQWTFSSNCPKTCTEMFNCILENHTRKSSQPIHWHCHDTLQTISPSIHWWIIAKLYMPSNNEQSTGPKEVDPLSLFQLLVHCKSFEDEGNCALEVIAVRNKLMHHSYNAIGEAEMAEAFKAMKALLEQKRIKPMSTEALKDIEKIEHERFFLNNTPKENYDIIRQSLDLKKRVLECEKKARMDKGISSTEIDKLLNETEKEIEKEIASGGKQVMNQEAIQDLQTIICRLEKECKDIKTEVQNKTERLDKQLSDSEKERRTLRKNFEVEQSETERLRQQLFDSKKECQTIREEYKQEKDKSERLTNVNDQLMMESNQTSQQKDKSVGNMMQQLEVPWGQHTEYQGLLQALQLGH